MNRISDVSHRPNAPSKTRLHSSARHRLRRPGRAGEARNSSALAVVAQRALVRASPILTFDAFASWSSSLFGPFLIRPREQLLAELRGLPDRMKRAAGQMEQGRAPRSLYRDLCITWPGGRLDMPRRDLAGLLTPAPPERIALADDELLAEVAGLRRKMLVTAIAVAHAVGREAEQPSERILAATAAVVEERWSPACLRQLIELETRQFVWLGTCAYLEPSSVAGLRGWEFGGPAAWLSLAAHVAAETRYGPRHDAAVLVGGLRDPDAIDVTSPERRDRAAQMLYLGFELSMPIWEQAGGIARSWSSPLNPTSVPESVTPQMPALPLVTDDLGLPEYVSVDIAADRLAVNRKTLYNAIRRHRPVPGVAAVGARYVIDWSAFAAAVARGDLRLR